LDFTYLYRPTRNNTDYINDQINYFKTSLNELKQNIPYYNTSKLEFFAYPLTNNKNYSYNLVGTLITYSPKDFETELHKNIILMDLYMKNKTLYYNNVPNPKDKAYQGCFLFVTLFNKNFHC